MTSPRNARGSRPSSRRYRDQARRRHAVESLGFLFAAIVALGLAALLAAVTR